MATEAKAEASWRSLVELDDKDLELVAEASLRPLVLAAVSSLLSAAAQSDRALLGALQRCTSSSISSTTSTSSSPISTSSSNQTVPCSEWPRALRGSECAALIALCLAWSERGDESHWQRSQSALVSLVRPLVLVSPYPLESALCVSELTALSPRSLCIAASALSARSLSALPWSLVLAAQSRCAESCASALTSSSSSSSPSTSAPSASSLLLSVVRVEVVFSAQIALLEALSKAELTLPVPFTAPDTLTSVLSWASSVRLVLASERCGNDLVYLASMLATRLSLITLRDTQPQQRSETLAKLIESSEAPIGAHSLAHSAMLRALALVATPSDLFLVSGASSLWRRLFSVLLAHCDRSADRFQRFVAFQGIEACLQQRLLVTAPMSLHVDEDRVLVDDTLALFQRHWEDPMDPVVSQIRLSFRTLLRVFDASPSLSASDPSFVPRIAQEYLALDGGIKGKYALLSTLADRLGAVTLLTYEPSLLSHLLVAMCSHNTIAVQIARFLEQVVKDLVRVLGAQVTCERVQEALAPVLLSSSLGEDSWQSVMHHALPWLCSLLAPAWPSLVAFVTSYDLHTAERAQVPSSWRSARLRSILALSQLARAQGVAAEINSGSEEEGSARVSALMAVAMLHSDADIRQSALELACTTHKKSESPKVADLDALLHFVRVALDEDSARHRDPRVQCVRRLLTRLRDSARRSLKAFDKGSTSQQPSASASASAEVTQAVRFVNALARLLALQLFPGASPARLCNALELLHSLLDVFAEVLVDARSAEVWERVSGERFALSSPLIVHALLHALSDSHSVVAAQVRELASRVLLLMRAPLAAISDLAALVTRALDHVSSVRALDASAGVWQLRTLVTLYVLRSDTRLHLTLTGTRLECMSADLSSTMSASERLLEVCSALLTLASAQVDAWLTDARSASRGVAIHGALAALREVMVDALRGLGNSEPSPLWKDFLVHVLALNVRVATLIRVFTHSLTYRDHFGRDFDTEMGSSAQVVGVSSWHAVKEALDTMAALFCDTPSAVSKSAFPLTALGDVGATVIDTMLSVIHKGLAEHEEPLLRIALQSLRDGVAGDLVGRWLDELLDVVNGHKYGSLVNTRRSAALPFAVRALLAAEAKFTNVSRPLQRRAVDRLIGMTNNSNETSSIHALNTLRGIILDKRIFDDVGVYLESTLNALFAAYRSPSWGVRNSATLTFSALVQRYTGLKNPGLSRRIKATKGVTVGDAFTRYPLLSSTLERELRSSQGDIHVDSTVFAALVFLSALLPPRVESQAISVISSKLLAALIPLSSSFSWFVRNMVALATLPLIPVSNDRSFIRGVLKDLRGLSGIGLNSLHGLLLILRRLGQTLDASSPRHVELANEILSELMSAHSRVFLLHAAVPVASLYLTLLRKYSKFLLASETSSEIRGVAQAFASDLVQRLSVNNESPVISKLSFLLEKEVVSFALVFSNASPKVLMKLETLIHSPHPEVRLEILSFITQAHRTSSAGVLKNYAVSTTETSIDCLGVLFRNVALLAPKLSNSESGELLARLSRIARAEILSMGSPQLRSAALLGAVDLLSTRIQSGSSPDESAEVLEELFVGFLDLDLPLDILQSVASRTGAVILNVENLLQPSKTLRLWKTLIKFLLESEGQVQRTVLASLSAALAFASSLSLLGILSKIFLRLSSRTPTNEFLDFLFETLECYFIPKDFDLDRILPDDEDEEGEGQTVVFAKDESMHTSELAFASLQASLPTFVFLASSTESPLLAQRSQLAMEKFGSTFNATLFASLLANHGIIQHSSDPHAQPKQFTTFEALYIAEIKNGLFASSLETLRR